MVILLQKLSGNNPYNNRVVVNYDDRTVDFTPVLSKHGHHKLFLGFILHVMIITAYLNFIPMLLFTFLFKISPEILIFCYLEHTLLVTMYYAVKYRDEYWRNECYPKVNAFLVQIFTFIFTFKKNKKYVVKPEQLTNNLFIVPRFANVKLKYKCTGDFNTVKKISINNLKDGNMWEWYCIFEFNKVVKKGFLEVELI